MLDTKKQKVFAISTERITRNKHDPFDISPIFSEIKGLNKIRYEVVSVPFNNFENNDFSLPTKFITFFIFVYSLFFRRKNNITLANNHKKLSGNYNNPTVIKIVQNLSILAKFCNKFLVKLTVHSLLLKCGVKFKKLNFFDHHLSHVVASYYLSDITKESKTLGVSIDGFGDGYWIKAFSIANDQFHLIGSGKVEKIWNKTHFICPSLGEIYGNFTEILGYKRNSDEGKVEAMAAFGTADNVLLKLLNDTFQINEMEISIKKETVLKFYDNTFLKSAISDIGRENFAATIQTFLEIFIVKYLKIINNSFDFKNICLAGGVTANIIMNMKIFENFDLDKFFIMPAMGDDGSSAGAAILAALEASEDLSWLRKVEMPYYGDEFSIEYTEKVLEKYKDHICWKSVENWEENIAEEINRDKVVSVFQGRSEFGPRALGNRSIMANPTSFNTRNLLNEKIKKRPIFQPFCPSILDEERSRLFIESFDHKFMAIAFRLKNNIIRLCPLSSPLMVRLDLSLLAKTTM